MSPFQRTVLSPLRVQLKGLKTELRVIQSIDSDRMVTNHSCTTSYPSSTFPMAILSPAHIASSNAAPLPTPNTNVDA